MKFTQIPDRLKYPPKCRAKLSTYHSSIISYVSEHYENKASFRRRVIQIMNTLTYRILSDDNVPPTWKESDPLSGLPCESDDVLQHHLSKLGIYIDDSMLIWDVDSTDNKSADSIVGSNSNPIQFFEHVAKSQSVKPESTPPTPKEDLYIQPPVVPRFDTTNPYVSQRDGNDHLVIYSSIPEVPTKQNEISVTTDINKISKSQLIRLFPNRFIHTRSSVMYEAIEGVEFDNRLGLIINVSGFSNQDVKNNIIQYPHIFQLKRVLKDGSVVNFYTTIEIDKVLYKVSDIWSSLDDTKNLPESPEYIKEYVVRRYLLERDIKGVVHEYPMFGTLDPFLTLFTTPDEYATFGYNDPIELATRCVLSRVSYKQSRNPILRRLNHT